MLWALSPHAGPDLEIWVRKAQGAGPAARSAFDHLVHTESPWLVGYLRSLLGDAGLADDAAQRTWLRAYLSLAKLQEAGAFRGWLRRIATRTAFNLRRDRGTRDRYEHAVPQAMYDPGHGEAMAAEEAILSCLDQLSYPYREILVLRYVEDLDMDEVQAMLDLGPSAAKMRLKRARDAFRAIYEEVADAEGP
jgi:RNA polymerase sigma-70 factor (ECF subfamily)